MKYSITTKVSISSKDLDGLLCSAFEGGSNYWYDQLSPLKRTSIKTSSSERFYENILKHGFTLRDYTGKGVIYKITPRMFSYALKLMANEYSKFFNDFISENYDAETGDVFLQLLVFKEVIYG